MGEVGHIDEQSNLGDWPDGERLLNRLPEHDQAQALSASNRAVVFSGGNRRGGMSYQAVTPRH